MCTCWPVGHVTHFAHYLEFILDSNFQFFMLQYSVCAYSIDILWDLSRA